MLTKGVFNHPEKEIKKTIRMLSSCWGKKAAVKKNEKNSYDDTRFDCEMPDFREELLPFFDHYMWKGVSTHLKHLVLSWGWVLYNQKTIHIEIEIINPVLEHIILGNFPTSGDPFIKEVIGQVYVDEAYHTFMALKACQVVSQERQLSCIQLPQYDLIASQLALMQSQDKVNIKLIQLATASVSETLISNYLGMLANDRSIQSICAMTVDMHRKDELSHGKIFTWVVRDIFPHLSKKQQNYYLGILPLAAKWFASQELKVWAAVLSHLGFPKCQQMLSDIAEQRSEMMIDFSGIKQLIQALDREPSDFFNR